MSISFYAIFVSFFNRYFKRFVFDPEILAKKRNADNLKLIRRIFKKPFRL